MNRKLMIAAAALSTAVAWGGTDAEIESRVEALLSRMTLDEKIGQLYQTHGKNSKTLEAQGLSDEKKNDKLLADIRAGRYGSLLGRRGVKGYNMVQKAAMESRLGIPLLIGHDLIHSARSCFPIPLALSCAWDEDLWRRTGEAIAVEAWTLGCNWTFTPMLDISLDARWDRIAESAGQDPHDDLGLRRNRQSRDGARRCRGRGRCGRKGAKLMVEISNAETQSRREGENENSAASATPHLCVKIPLADGNPDSRVYAYEVVAVGDEGAQRLFKAVYAAGVNLGMGHEPNGGVTALEIQKSELPTGKTLTIAARPLSSLGTKGKAIAAEWKI